MFSYPGSPKKAVDWLTITLAATKASDGSLNVNDQAGSPVCHTYQSYGF